MALHPQAGELASPEQLINVAKLVADYYSLTPDPTVAGEAVSFGTSGHRGSASLKSFNDAHIAAICQALAEYRASEGISGPLFIGKDTHALSEPALQTAISVLVANQVQVVLQREDNESKGFTPTPVISRTIIRYNREHQEVRADGVVITPSHNPPEDGGFKYNPPHGGPAGGEVTNLIQARANQLLAAGNQDVKRVSVSQALASEYLSFSDFMHPYINELEDVIDMQAIAKAGLKLATDPLGGAGTGYWQVICQRYGIDIEVVNTSIDQRFAFMHRDKDGKIRMDCSSAYAMTGLIRLSDKFDLAWGNDPDFDRHGIVCKGYGLMNPNHYLAVAIDYLYRHRPHWPSACQVGKTLVSSGLIDRVVAQLGRPLAEMPVGFKWFVDGLSQGQIGFAGEESAGGIFLQRDGRTWATDKDGFILCLLAAEIMAVTGEDPASHYKRLISTLGEPSYKRIDVAATHEQKQRLSSMDKSAFTQDVLAGEKITQVETHAAGNNASIGGIKVSTQNGWFAARPSGTENVYKIYAESFLGETHLQRIIAEAEQMVAAVIH